MDDASRPNRSKRSPRRESRQGTDLKMAARGVAILLREQFSKLKRKGAPQIDRAPTPHRAIALLERYTPRRIGALATIALVLGSVGFGVVKGGHVDELVATASDLRNAAANAAGFRITTVAVNGRKQLSQDEILAVGGVNGRSSLLFLDAAVVRDRLKANPWIADATVLKLYPGALQIDITERSAFAVWQQDGKLSVISEDGAILEPYVARHFTNLPLVVGKGAETRAKDFLALVAKYPQVDAQRRAAILVGERRWNLRLKDGIDVRLPENDIGNALARLTKLDREERLFSRDITAIDMRLPDRLTVRLSEDAAKAREEMFKDKKPKKKADSA